MIFNKRKRKTVLLTNDFSKIEGSIELIKEGGICSNLNELYFDINSVYEFENLLIFYLPFRSYQKSCIKKEKFLTKLVIVDKTYRCLIIFKTYDDMLKYVSGQQNYQYYYQVQLTSFFNISETNKIVYNKEICFWSKNNQEDMYSCNLILKNKEHYKCIYEFASIHEQKISIFTKAIKDIVQFKLMYG